MIKVKRYPLSQILNISQNPTNVDSMSQPDLIEGTESDIGRPEKRELYSAWLHQPKIDNDNNKKIF